MRVKVLTLELFAVRMFRTSRILNAGNERKLFWHCFLRADRARMTAFSKPCPWLIPEDVPRSTVAPDCGGRLVRGGARGNWTLGEPACHGDGRLPVDSPHKTK